MLSQSRLRATPLCLAAALICFSCARPVDQEGFTRIDMEIDPRVLPYGFVQIASAANHSFPYALDAAGTPGAYEIQNDWRKPDTLSAVIFGRYPNIGGNRIDHFNLNTSRIISNRAFDYDHDGVDEVAVTYRHADRLWLEILDAFEGPVFRTLLAEGHDTDGSGFWDGRGVIAAIGDLTGDGFVEILVGVFTGYDLSPRRLTCVDQHHGTILWEFDVAGSPGSDEVRILTGPAPGDTVVLLGVSSPANGVTAGGMDDSHSYLICLNRDGSRRWLRTMGGVFTGTRPVLGDYDGDGVEDVFAAYATGEATDGGEAGVAVLNLDGDLLDSCRAPSLVHDLIWCDHDNDGTEELLVFLLDNTLTVYGRGLRATAGYRFDQPMRFIAREDYLGRGQPQILLRASNSELWLYDGDFTPLALVSDAGHVEFVREDPSGGIIFLVHRGNTTESYRLVANPWYQSLYLRYKNEILILFGAVFAALATAIIFHARARANLITIRGQKTELERVHHALVDAQQKIIAQEKYNQARDIAGGVAHEIHNALCPALNALDKLRSRLALPGDAEVERNRELLQLGEDAVARGMKMTELVTSYSRLESEKRGTAVDLGATLRETVSDNRLRVEALGVTVRIGSDDGCVLSCNPMHAYAMLNNLVVNALDALADVSDKRLTASVRRSPDGIAVVIADTGAGIPPDAREKIFDVFYSTRPNTGTGIGLAMVRKIVELYGGTITVQSALDTGAKFAILFPAS